MFCSQCGNNLPESAKFCSSCGRQLGGAASPGNAAAPHQPIQSKGRYRKVIKTHCPAREYEAQVSRYLQAEGFSIVTYKGELFWKKGKGILAGPQYISVEYQEYTIMLEAFIKYAVLPGVYAGEFGTTGIIGALPKIALRNRIQAIEAYITGIAAAR